MDYISGIMATLEQVVHEKGGLTWVETGVEGKAERVAVIPAADCMSTQHSLRHFNLFDLMP